MWSALRRAAFAAALPTALWAFTLPAGSPALAMHPNGSHGQMRVWDIGADPNIAGLDPLETVDDVDGLTNHVGAPAMVTAMEMLGAQSMDGLLFWNPDTNAFKSYPVGGGTQFAVDINRGTPAPVDSSPGTFGGGDTWATIYSNAHFSPYVNFRGSDNFRRWTDTGAFGATGIRVNPSTGKVYFGTLEEGEELNELDPATNTLRTWATVSRPYNLAFAGDFLFATAINSPRCCEEPDQILRLNLATNELTRWDVPGWAPFSPNFERVPSFGLGAPNGIAVDEEGGIWFAESAADQVGRLNPTTSTIDEFTSPNLDNPQAIANTGSGANLQAWFTEANNTGPEGTGHVSILYESLAAPASTTVVPRMETVSPASRSLTPLDFTVSPSVATITPSTFALTSIIEAGIDRFPVPPGTSEPAGMSRIVFPDTVFGTMEGSDHVFEFTNGSLRNRRPVAVDDSASGRAGFPIKINVLANDSDADGDSLTVSGVTDPANGSAAVNGDNTVTYDPDGCFIGTDTFNYTISDGRGLTDTGVISVRMRKTSRRSSIGC